MGGYILRDKEQRVSLPAQRVDRLLSRGDGDAALLYLFLSRTDRGVTPEEIQQRLHWTQLRFAAAERTLRQLGLLDGESWTPPEPAEERTAYTGEDIANLLEGDKGFAALVPQTEEKLGKKLKTADLQILAGLYDDLRLPPDVIYLLVNHCIRRMEQRYGEGRRPTLRQIEKEGYYWASQGLYDQESAGRYLRRYDRRQSQMSAYLRAVQITSRRAVDSEERYINDWIEKGYSPELVAAAYDQTIFYRKELNWRYLNGVLRRWEENGWHTPEEAEQGCQNGAARQRQKSGGKNDWMTQFIKR